MRKTKLLAIFLVILLCAGLIVAMASCSPRTDDFEDDVSKGKPVVPEPVKRVRNLQSGEARDKLVEAFENSKYKYPSSENSEWYVIDLRFRYHFEDYLTTPSR